MKSFHFHLFLFLLFAFPQISSSQKNFEELQYEVNSIHPYISITKEQLKEAKTLSDIKHQTNNRNLSFDSSWIKEYISVEVAAVQNGKFKKIIGENDILKQEQKDLMYQADAGTDISVQVKYIPENTLSYNSPKELDFTFTVSPENEAKYPEGQQALEEYLKEKAIDKISTNSFQGYDLIAVKFTINEEGEIINPHIFDAEYRKDRNEKIETLLLETIRHMPCWKPAEYPDGTKVKQEFVLTVGNMENCIVNLLNIDRNE